MHKPIIGVTTYSPREKAGFHTPVAYLNAIIRAGGVPMQLPLLTTALIPEWLATVQGLVFVGGSDIGAHHYGAAPHPLAEVVYPLRDEVELALLTAALQQALPILAICRGMQLLNVVQGGSLHQHLPDVVGHQVAHRTALGEACMHTVRISPESALANRLGTSISVSSLHHQGVDQLGVGLAPIAWTEDGVIEALSLMDVPQVKAVQWHPEMTADHDPKQQGLFDDLVVSARALRPE
ncbi:MAG: gamma-glutamyl-gamma-aminobutyrate hydrolase family protein [Neisseriaceae bacterium]|nr:gamma-glutamyl-gamma-aminobutyrate hydrolase family protein [Neisseriaceae bacterium]MBP6861055.1 gamma-glutamyl-gamma-aminobutyrate hydrolase family protein [Neisseriaceae bacterium]